MTVYGLRSVRHVIAAALAAVLVVAAFSVTSEGAASSTQASPIRVYVDTEEITFDVAPASIQGTTLVQFRPLFQAMGLEVGWDAAGQRVTGTAQDLAIELRLGSKEANVNGQPVALAQAPQVINGSTMVPLRFVGEATGALVYWDAAYREITIVTVEGLDFLGVTKEQLLQMLEEYAATRPPAESNAPQTPQPDPEPAEENDAVTQLKPVDPNVLKGSYYGLRDDFGGYECGGMCWDIYTFLPNKQILIGPPPQGGPETIDCKRDGCSTYKIENGSLTISSGESLPIGMSEEGKLVINEVDMEPIKPVQKGLLLQDTYKYIGYSGFVGLSPYSSAWTDYMTFNRDGTFESSDTSMATLDTGSAVTNAAGTDSSTGTYAASGNTMTLTYNDGTVERMLFFLHNDGSLDEIQLGEDMYYIDDDE